MAASAPARFKDLCIDATDPAGLARFWAAAIGLEPHYQDNGDAYLLGKNPAETIWVNLVPEPKQTKLRTHLDVYGSSAEALTDIGATVLDATSFRWVVMADPEGNEFCLFPTAEPPEHRLYEIVIDAGDHRAQSRWWADTIGGRAVDDERGYAYVADIPGAPFKALSFVPVPEPKSVKNRVHLDLVAEDLTPLLASGATLIRPQDDEIGWDVLVDPEGNEFCVFKPTP